MRTIGFIFLFLANLCLAVPPHLAVVARKNAVTATLPDTSTVIAWWAMEQSAGATATDSSANANNAGDVGTVGSTTGKVSNAADFNDAIPEYFEIIEASAGDFEFGGNDFSIAFWVYADTLQFTQLIGKWGTSGDQRTWRIYMGGTGAIGIAVSTAGTAATATTHSSGVSISTGSWNFVYAYRDASTGELGASVNNSTPATTTASSSSLYNGTAKFNIASEQSSNPLDGRLDEVAVFNRILTAGEVTQLYNSGSGVTYSDLPTP